MKAYAGELGSCNNGKVSLQFFLRKAPVWRRQYLSIGNFPLFAIINFKCLINAITQKGYLKTRIVMHTYLAMKIKGDNVYKVLRSI